MDDVEQTHRARPSRSASRWLHGRRRLQVAALAGAPALWIAVLYAGSLLSLFVTSLYTLSEDGAHIEHTLSADNYREILDEPVYRDVALRTLKVAVLVTLIDIVLALPIAFYMAKIAKARWRGLLVAAVLVPLWGSYLVKAFAWRSILGKPGGLLDAIWALLVQHANIVTILAHLGGGLPFFAFMPEVRALFNRTYIDTAAVPWLYDAAAIVSAVRAVGVERVLFGTDFPLRRPGRDLQWLSHAGLDHHELSKVQGGNAASLLKLERRVH